MCKSIGRLRRLPEIECLFPKTVRQALSMLESHQEDSRAIAGGTDIINKLKRRFVSTRYLVDLKAIPDLDFVVEDSQGLRIGAVASLSDILDSPLVRRHYPIIIDAVSVMASPQIRNTATMVGNLCNAVPSADSAPPLIALQAKLRIVNSRGQRTVPVETFFTGPGKTVLTPRELVQEILIPSPKVPSAGTYLKHMLRSEMDLAVVGVGVYLTLNSEDKTCTDARIVLGAVAPTPIRAQKAEDILKDKTIDNNLMEECAKIASTESKPIDDIRGSADYRKKIVSVLAKRAIQQCLVRLEAWRKNEANSQ